jgi:hypothetical protein
MQIASPTYHQTIKQLDDAVFHFLTTGVVELADPYVDQKADYTTRRKQWRDNAPSLPKQQLRKLVRKIAKELKRPIIIVETSWYPDPAGTIVVKLKKLKRHAPLMTTFFLLEQFDGGYYQMDTRKEGESAFRWMACATEWRLVFIGKEGRAQFEEWMEFIQKTPECRKALKIPEPVGETDGTDLLPRRDQDRLQRQGQGQALPEGAASDGARSAGDCELVG